MPFYGLAAGEFAERKVSFVPLGTLIFYTKNPALNAGLFPKRPLQAKTDSPKKRPFVIQSVFGSRFPTNQRRVAPEVFQTIKGAFGLVKDVDNYLQVIEHHPLAGWKPVDCHWSNRMILSQSRFNLICDRFKLRLGCGGANHEEICKRGNRAQIQHDDVLRLFVRGEFRAGFC